jgi:hypothetical protein
MLECNTGGVVYLQKDNNDVTQEEVFDTINETGVKHK